MAKIKVSDYISRFIAGLGVRHVFIVSGGGNTHLIDSIAADPNLTYVCNHHEQASAMAAEGYARANENIGVCVVTFGPAATNTLTGVAGAWLDSIPTLFISGQTQRKYIAKKPLRQLGVQEINIIDMASPIPKWAYTIDKPEDIRWVLERAAWEAKSGRPGPVFLDIPSDVQGSLVEEDSLKGFDAKTGAQIELTFLTESVMKCLSAAKKPLLFVGHGIRLAKARKELALLINLLQIPVVTSMSAHDLIESDHPLYAGRPGLFGDRAGNLAVQNADLILSIGVRHQIWNIGYDTHDFGRNAKKIVVDIDHAELDKETYRPDLAICADAKAFVLSILSSFPNVSFSRPDWIKRCASWRFAHPVISKVYPASNYVNSYHFTGILSSLLKNDEIIMTGVGSAFTGTLQSLDIKRDQRLHCNVGCASMGWDLPAAIGASFASGKRVVLLTGDGGIMMNIQELQTIAHHKLPIKIFLFNNAGYLAIKNTQNSQFGGRLNAVDEKTGVSLPDFEKVATAFGIHYVKISDNGVSLGLLIDQVLSYDGPVFCDISMDPNQPLIPRLDSEIINGKIVAKPLDQMFPRLTSEETSS